MCLQVAGVCGVSGHSAVASVEAGFKPGLGPASRPRRSHTCVRVWWRRAGPATHSPAWVSSSFSACARLHLFSTSMSVSAPFNAQCSNVCGVCNACVNGYSWFPLSHLVHLLLCVYVLYKSEFWLKECMLERGLWSMKKIWQMRSMSKSLHSQMAKRTQNINI